MKKPIVPAGGLCGLQVCAVCLAEYDSPSVLHGPLFKARRAYYENGNRVRVSLVTRSRGVTTHYHGVISHTGFKWKESSETGAFCRSFRLRGQDICLYYDAHGRLIRRTVYSCADWLRTDYFSVKDGVYPVVSLVADDTQDRLLRYDRVPDKDPPVYTCQQLLPLKLEVDTALQSYVNTEVGDPAVVLARTDGDYVYCTAEEKNRREQLAEKGLPPELLEDFLSGGETPAVDEGIPPVLLDKVLSDPAAADPAALPEMPASEREIPEQEAEPAETSAEDAAQSEETDTETAEEPDMPEEGETSVPAFLLETEPPAPVEEETDASQEDAQPETPEAEEKLLLSEETRLGAAAAPVFPSQEEEAENEALFSSLLAQRGGEVVFSRGDTRYRYTGGMVNGRRDGRGRTEQENGLTAYDGEYRDGQREGFGSLYYKNGALCYAGRWKDNRRDGLGVSFRSDDQSVHVGKWENGERIGMDFLFDKDGRLCVIRNSKDGTEEPKTIFCIDNSGTVISGLDVDPEDGRGNEFDDEGRLLYTGFHKNGLREGQGTSFYPDGRVEFTGQWKSGQFADGVYFGPNGAGRFKAGDLN